MKLLYFLLGAFNFRYFKIKDKIYINKPNIIYKSIITTLSIFCNFKPIMNIIPKLLWL